MDTADVDILPAEDGKCRVVCVEREQYPHTVDVENGTLIVRSAKDQKWNFSIGAVVKNPSVTVYLPAADYESLKLEADTGAVKLVAGLSFGTVDMDAHTGAVTVDGRDGDGFPQPQVVELIYVRIHGTSGVHLVHRQHHRPTGA